MRYQNKRSTSFGSTEDWAFGQVRSLNLDSSATILAELTSIDLRLPLRGAVLRPRPHTQLLGGPSPALFRTVKVVRCESPFRSETNQRPLILSGDPFRRPGFILREDVQRFLTKLGHTHARRATCGHSRRTKGQVSL